MIMAVFSQAVVKLMAASIICSICEFVLPSGRIGKSAQRGVNVIMLLLTVETVTALFGGI